LTFHTLGERVGGRTLIIPPSILTESVPGQIYQVEVATEGVPDPSRAVGALKTELPQKFPGLKVRWVEVRDDAIRLQLEGSPFLWAAVLAFLPQILLAAGVVVTLIAVYLVLSGVPSWLFGLAAVGLVLLLLTPKLFRRA